MQKVCNEQNIKNWNKDGINIINFSFCLKLQYHSEGHCYWSRLLKKPKKKTKTKHDLTRLTLVLA